MTHSLLLAIKNPSDKSPSPHVLTPHLTLALELKKSNTTKELRLLQSYRSLDHEKLTYESRMTYRLQQPRFFKPVTIINLGAVTDRYLIAFGPEQSRSSRCICRPLAAVPPVQFTQFPRP